MALVSLANAREQDWVRPTFFRPIFAGADIDLDSASYTSAKSNVFDTTPGGNRSINPPYQLLPWVDIREPSLASDSTGMGRYYADAIDRNAHRVSFQFGYVRHNGLANVLSSFSDRGASVLANTGVAVDGVFSAHNLGKAVGTLLTLPLQAFFGLNYLYRRVKATVTGRPYSKFSYLEPAMPLYLNAASIIFNQITTALNLTHGFGPDDIQGDGITGSGTNVDDAAAAIDYTELQKILPSSVRANSHASIDLFAIVSKAQRLDNQRHKAMARLKKTSRSPEELAAKVKAMLEGNEIRASDISTVKTLDVLVSDYLKTPLGADPNNDENLTGVIDPNAEGKQAEAAVKKDASGNPELPQTIRKDEAGFFDFYTANLNAGSAFVTFSVDGNESVSETFSNSSKATGIQEKINEVNRSAKSIKSNLAGGNLSDGVLADTAEGVASVVTDFIGGGLESIGLYGLSTLVGNTNIDIPNTHDQSSVTFPSASYSVVLGGGYGHPIAKLFDMYLPLSLLLAAVLSKSTGKSGYTDPFACRFFDPGRVDIKLGQMRELQITRFFGAQSTTERGLPCQIKVDFSVDNFNNSVHMPISDSLLDTALGFSPFDEDTALTDYLSLMGGQTLRDQFYAKPRAQLAWARTQASFDQLTSPAYLAAAASNTSLSKLIEIFARPGLVN